MFDLFGKTIVITGASSGIGRECAILCSRMGASLILFGRNEEQLKNTLSKLEGKNHFIFNNDIREIEKIDLSIGQVVRELGPIDGLIHSAGIQYTLPLRMHNKSIYYDQLDVNTIGGFEVCRIITKMNYFNSEGGSLVLIASIRGILGAGNQIGYAASKGALIAGMRSMSVELALRKIRVNSISPGIVGDTEMTKNLLKQLPEEWSKENQKDYPLGWVSAVDVANACVFLLSKESNKITGTNIIIDGGFSSK